MKMMPVVRALALLLLTATGVLHAQVPQILNYQGRIAVGTVNFDGTGHFKFALVDGAGTTAFWSNDGSLSLDPGVITPASQPASAVSLPVAKGLYSVPLGDTTVTNMTAVPAAVFTNSDVRLRVWFDNGTNGFQLLSPDQRIAAVGYAIMAGSVADGAITSASLAPEIGLWDNAGGNISYAGGRVGIGGSSTTHQLTISSFSSDKVLRLIGPNSFGHGAHLNFGDGDFVYLGEDVDDTLTIDANNVGIGATPAYGGPLVQVFGTMSVAGTLTATAFNGSGAGLTSGPFLQWVTIGNPGNASDPATGSLYGAVAQSFRISKYEVTNAQYAQFLNAVATTDTYGLYSAAMATDPRGGIMRSGTSGSYSYAVKKAMGTKPVVHVSFYDAVRFCNWLHNGMKSGFQDTTTTEAGAYTITGGTTVGSRNGGALYFLPRENEWYKAAYYDPNQGGAGTGGYWTYPTQSSGAPSASAANAIGDMSTVALNLANFNNTGDWNGQNGNLTTVGSGGPGTESAYGAADMAGNAIEWNETIVTGSDRGQRGGSWADASAALQSSARGSAAPASESNTVGFRVARP